MLKSIRIRRWQVPNALAIAAALLLLVSSVARVEQSAEPGDFAAALAAPQAEAASPAVTSPEHQDHVSAKHSRKFRVNLFLFRH